MTSLCFHLSAQEIVNWVTTADGCVHTDDTTKLSPTSCEFVFTPPTPTRQNSFFASSASAMCIGHNSTEKIRFWLIASIFSHFQCNHSQPLFFALRSANVDELPSLVTFADCPVRGVPGSSFPDRQYCPVRVPACYYEQLSVLLQAGWPRQWSLRHERRSLKYLK